MAMEYIIVNVFRQHADDGSSSQMGEVRMLESNIPRQHDWVTIPLTNITIRSMVAKVSLTYKQAYCHGQGPACLQLDHVDLFIA